MNPIITLFRRAIGESRERGSALLVTLMVIVGLSLLGLAFMAVSETENAISINEKNYVQVLALAESGTRLAVEWFQDPENAKSILINTGPNVSMLPTNINAYKIIRTVPSVPYSGRYKENSTFLLFDKAYRPDGVNRFYGNFDSADVIINDSTTQGKAYLGFLNAYLFGNLEGSAQCRIADGTVVRCSRVSEFRVYSPPQVGGVWTADAGGNLFLDGGTRFGLATVAVTAEKREPSPTGVESPIIARRTVISAISEWPFPGPQGPIQSNANINTGGNMGVHWGRMTAVGNIEDSRPRISIPWHDAHQRIHFERGYNTSWPWTASTTYQVGQFVFTTDATFKLVSFQCATAGTSDTVEPTWSDTLGATVTETGGSTVTWIVRTPRNYPVDGTRYNTVAELPLGRTWLDEMIDREFEDPWFEARARIDMIIPSGIGLAPPQINGYTGRFLDEDSLNWSLYQNQNQDDGVFFDTVTFPQIEYDFWKEIAVQGNGENHVNYLRWVSGVNYSDGITSKPFAQWVNTDPGLANPAEAGFYFFDSRNGVNPQTTGGPASPFLTPAIAINNSDANPLLMKGFIYLNTVTYGSTGVNGILGNYNMPGEPYRDLGFYEADDVTGNYIPEAGSYKIYGRNDFKHSYQDLNNNGSFDYRLAARTVCQDDTNDAVDNCVNSTLAYYFPVPYSPECGIAGIPNLVTGDDPYTAGTCSEPHEPYLNLQYPVVSTSAPGPGVDPPTVRSTWGNTTTPHVARAKKHAGDGTLPVCATTPDLCTSPGYDEDGGFYTFEPMMIGVLYNEGGYTATGNAPYFGSLLINGPVGKAGTTRVYFDESLIKGDWVNQFDFPRVYISASQTDQ